MLADKPGLIIVFCRLVIKICLELSRFLMRKMAGKIIAYLYEGNYNLA
jgi:hypothetical protein